MKKVISIFLAVLLIMTQVASVEAAKKTTVSLNEKSISLYKGKTKTLKAVVKNKKAGAKIVWSSKKKSIATVSSKGVVKAVKPGITYIYAKVSGTTAEAVCKVKVGDYAKSLTLVSATSVLLKEGETSQVTTSISPSTVLDSSVSYSVKDSSIAAVTKNGFITAKKEGLTQITVKTAATTAKGKKFTQTIYVNVSKAEESKGDDSGNSGGSGGGSGSSPSSPLIGSPSVNGAVTTYTLDKSYKESAKVTITVGGQTWTNSGTVSFILDNLTTIYTEKTNAAKTISIKRVMGEEWWTATDLTTNEILFRIKGVVSAPDNDSYGQVLIEKVNGTVDVVIQ